MYIEAVGRQIAVCSFEGALRLTASDKRYWNVVSIGGPREEKSDLRLAKSFHYACFDDTEESCSTVYRSPRSADIAEIFDYIGNLGSGPPPPPLLIHCQQGISRSTAVALSWLYGQLPRLEDRVLTAIDVILQLRPQAKPNGLVLTLGLAQFVPLEEAQQLADRMLAEPRLARNRFESPLQEL
ncbi:MAG TPA: hypothetical protein VL361_05185 [Candidatus Limnocylindrales bacterium]|jgi:predicted protein tyrosine phosphatase|nr:hypothetical protein [Candidatus Limnocylindrales bacterium]